MCMCQARSCVGGEWMRRLGLLFSNPVETGGVMDVCVCLVVVVGRGIGPWSGGMG